MCFTCWLRSGFSHFIYMDSLSFTWYLVAAESRISKQSCVQDALQSQYTLYNGTGADHVLPFLDVLINNTDLHQSVTHLPEKNFTGLLTSYLSFCPFTYKLGLFKTLIDRTFKINNTWMGFHTDLQKCLSFCEGISSLKPYQQIYF